MVDSPQTASAAPAGFSGVYVFGDSLVDPGNDLKVAQLINSLPAVGLPNGAPTADKGYFEGRFSNGFNYADLVANKFLGEPTQPTFPYGVTNLFAGFSLPVVGQPAGNNLSFAYGGATTLAGSEPIPSLHNMIGAYSAFTPDPNALYVISVGANDLLKLVPTGGNAVVGAQADATLSSVASEIAQEAAGLYARGARHILVANVPDISVTPSYSGDNEATQRSLLSQYAQTVNGHLNTDLAALAVPAGGSLSVFDFFGYTDQAATNPAYHFTNVTQALTSVQPTSPDPTGAGFLFFDKLHPTAQAQAQIASQVLHLIQNPGTAIDWTPAPAIGSQAGASIVQAGASDSFAAGLTAGHTYTLDALGISTASGTLPDPVVRVLDSSGNVVAQADDGGVGLDSHLQFTASATATYSIVVSGVGVSAGSFHMQLGDTNGINLLLNGALIGNNVAVAGGAGADTLVAASGANTLTGAAGEDSITGGTGFDAINGNMGGDTIVGQSQVGDWLVGGQGNDLITAHSSAHNLLIGNLGSDTLVAGSGGDTLVGGKGDDSIMGGAGADWISGDRGTDTVTGGAGADIFHSAPGYGVMTVTDFKLMEGDRVVLDPGTQFTTSQAGVDVHVDITGGGQVILQNVQLSSLGDGWIIT